jgi:hypothetical protein
MQVYDSPRLAGLLALGELPKVLVFFHHGHRENTLHLSTADASRFLACDY